uniref:Uncharacterized protein n=1 Tax=Chromera velia CCMP2878 TaxID=1169474 RepID=A0A0G4GYW4_9ALVE|eukprot:Cvel_23971.t1-p1 / transcript=Cvel_23971.t1 / gene=Cvel_23971 / organism=Chromera_velia_CCMP2878 / gene_product=hypothetical protein / transcript_product=hypothetical protein / location=Cvel_scaffold2537:7295-8956(-) / protein_length=194 / sequence_SO=supercontig / SO=protein_coding / is_pseudo=false
MLPRKFLELADEFERVKDTESGEGKRLKFEIGQEKRRCMENRGELVEEVKIDEFVGSGYCWRDLGVVTLKERAVLSKFCGARVWNEPRHSKKTLKRNFTAGSNLEEPKIQRGQCTIDKLDGVRTTKGRHQIVHGMAALSLSGAPQMRAGFQRLNPQSARLTNAPFASTRNPNTVIPRRDPTQIPASAAATGAHA